jgi:hypothetical protein
MFVTVEGHMEHGERGKGKERDRNTTKSKYFISGQVEDIVISTESCQMMGCGREGVRKNNRSG